MRILWAPATGSELGPAFPQAGVEFEHPPPSAGAWGPIVGAAKSSLHPRPLCPGPQPERETREGENPIAEQTEQEGWEQREG